MRTSTGLLLVLASAASAALGAALSRKQGTKVRLLSAGAGFMIPWSLHALFSGLGSSRDQQCVILFVTDTHGAAEANLPLVQRMLAETDVDRVIHAGDFVENADLWPVWWDQPFAAIVGRWPIDAASGNHDHADAETYAGFVRRFGEEPHSVVCGPVEFFLVPWGLETANGRWLHERVTASTARWKVLVAHRPFWGVDGTGQVMRDLYADSLPFIDLVLTGHQHVSHDSVHVVNGRRIRQIIDVSGPKKYECPTGVSGCIDGETAYWRIEFNPDEIKATRRVV